MRSPFSTGDRAAGRHHRRTTTVVSAALLAMLTSPTPAGAATTVQTASCVDGGGVRWTARAVWGPSRMTAEGTRRSALEHVRWTTAARRLPTDSEVKTYDETGRRIQSMDWTGTFDYRHATRFKKRTLKISSTSPRPARIQLSLGRDGDGFGNCTTAFTEPTAGPSAATGLNLWRTPQPQNSITGQGAAFDRYKMVPTFIWEGDWNLRPTQEVAGWAAGARQAGQVLPLALYAFPRTGYSAGGINSLSAYRAWIDQVSAGLGASRAIIVVEPDALNLPNRMADGTKPETAIAYAVTKFKTANVNAKVYIESSFWFDARLQAQRLRAAGIADAAGFAMNVSSFETTPKVAAISEQVVTELARAGVPGKKYLIDTGRNGNGPLTAAFGPAAEPWLSRGLPWLNPPGRGLGLSPRVINDPAYPNFAAAVWVKPPGATDGQDPGTTWSASYFPHGAPPDGQFWLEWMTDALAHTNMANLE